MAWAYAAHTCAAHRRTPACDPLSWQLALMRLQADSWAGCAAAVLTDAPHSQTLWHHLRQHAQLLYLLRRPNRGPACLQALHQAAFCASCCQLVACRCTAACRRTAAISTCRPLACFCPAALLQRPHLQGHPAVQMFLDEGIQRISLLSGVQQHGSVLSAERALIMSPTASFKQATPVGPCQQQAPQSRTCLGSGHCFLPPAVLRRPHVVLSAVAPWPGWQALQGEVDPITPAFLGAALWMPLHHLYQAHAMTDDGFRRPKYGDQPGAALRLGPSSLAAAAAAAKPIAATAALRCCRPPRPPCCRASAAATSAA